MATASTPATASIAIPADVHPFAANVSPRGVDLEGRLDLSLDALIKERRKEHKLQKKEEAKKQKQSEKPQPQSAGKRKTPKQQKPQQQQQQLKQKQQKAVKNGQAAQRKAQVNKNRGLPAAPAPAKESKTKTSIAATTAKLRRQMRADKAAKNASGRLVVSPRAQQNNVAQQPKKKKNAAQQVRKVASPTRVVQPKAGKKQQVVKQQPQTQAPARQVMRSNSKKTKLSITIPGSVGKKNVQKKQKKQANKVLLPGKLSQTLAKKNSAAKSVVKRAKNRKAAAGKATQVVRKVPTQRKKKN